MTAKWIEANAYEIPARITNSVVLSPGVVQLTIEFDKTAAPKKKYWYALDFKTKRYIQVQARDVYDAIERVKASLFDFTSLQEKKPNAVFWTRAMTGMRTNRVPRKVNQYKKR